MLSENIKFIRKQLGMSQQEFAKILGRAQSVICHWEAGTKTPSYQSLLLLDKLAKQNKIKINLLTE